MASSAKEKKVQDSKCSREFQTLWTEKYGMISKGDKAVCVLCSGIVKRYYYKKLQVLPKLEKNIKDLDAQKKRNEETVIDEFISIIDSLIKEFSAKFPQSKELSETFKFTMYPDGISFDKLNLA
ncbi:dimer_Tnp_hAT domain-containing protein [Trichonephila clavipes]|nr:dimer_Tnp_hAT domain-containing protein [Trichonephila clavipes]